jgi:hypothetical protein
MRASVSSTREPMKPESPRAANRVSECRQSGGVDHEFTQTPLAKHASLSGSLVAEVSSLCISSVRLITLGLPRNKPRDSALVNPVFFANCFGAKLFGLFYYRQRLSKLSGPVPRLASLSSDIVVGFRRHVFLWCSLMAKINAITRPCSACSIDLRIMFK